MARIVMTTLGSSGDLHPFLALALGLRARGHAIHFATEAIHEARITALGFPMTSLTGDSALMLAPYNRELFEGNNPLASVRVLYGKWIIPILRPHIEELRALVADADFLISSAQQIASHIVAELTGIPWASVALTPLVLAAPGIEAVALPPMPERLERAINDSAPAVGALIFRRLVDDPINAIRAEYGLPPRADMLTTGPLSHRLTAVASSPAFVPPPPAWPSWAKMTGFLFWDTPEGWTEPEALTAFFNGPLPVVVVSSGSISEYVPHVFDRFYRTSLNAIWSSGARALVIGAPPGALPDPLPDWIYALPYAPFSHIYPRCAAVIHHGGIGTTAQGLRAGVPQMIAPWGADQFFHGAQITRLGAGHWMTRRAYRPTKATKALRTLLTMPRYQQAASAIATQIAGEDGVTTLCDAIEAAMPQHASVVA